MLYAFFGDDTVKVRKEAAAFVAEREKKGAEVARIQSGEFVSGSLADAAGSASLFGKEQVVVIDTPSEEVAMFEQVFEMLEVFADSETVFVLIEGKLLAPEKKKLQKYAKECVELTGEKVAAFNTFGLSDALADRDKKKLWILLAEAKRQGQSAEELVGLLFWQIKTLRLALKTGSAEEAGIKPFVYSKAKRALLKFKDGELDRLSETLTTLYHEGHAGKKDIDVALERWVLAL